MLTILVTKDPANIIQKEVESMADVDALVNLGFHVQVVGGDTAEADVAPVAAPDEAPAAPKAKKPKASK